MKKYYCLMQKYINRMLVVILMLFCNQMFSTTSNYTFDNKSGAYTPLGASKGTLIAGGSANTVVSAVKTIGFNFKYMGIDYTQFSVNSGGLMKFGSVAVTNEKVNNVYTTTNVPKLSACWNQMNNGTAASGGGVFYELSGAVGSQVLTIEWNLANNTTLTTVATSHKFQIKLYEGTNKIEYIYGTGVNTTTNFSTFLGGLVPNDDIISVFTQTGCIFEDITNFNNNNVWPASGTTYSFTPTTATGGVTPSVNSNPPSLWLKADNSSVTNTVYNMKNVAVANRTASSSYGNPFTIANSVLSSTNSWTPSASDCIDGTACTGPSKGWIQLDLGSIQSVDGIATKGGNTDLRWAKEVTVYTSNDGVNYTYGGYYLANNDATTTRYIDFNTPLSTRYIKVFIGKGNVNYPLFRLDAYTKSSTVATNGQNVTDWYDLSGNNTNSAQSDLSTVAKQPIYNENVINFNPGLKFTSTGVTATSSLMDISDFKDIRSAYWVVQDYSNGSASTRHVLSSGTSSVSFYGGASSFIDKNNLAGSVWKKEGSTITPTTKKYDFGGLNIGVPNLVSTVSSTNTFEAQSLGNKFTSGEAFNGIISEVILFKNDHSASVRSDIESYLALKYGITLPNDYVSNGTTYWSNASNSGYNNNIFGIGRKDSIGLHQRQSKSSNLSSFITIGNNNIINTTVGNSSSSGNDVSTDNSYLVFGDDNATIDFDFNQVSLNYFHTVRSWKLQETGTIGSVKVSIPAPTNTQSLEQLQDFSSPFFPNSDVYLAVDNDGNFSNGGTTYTKMTKVGSGTNATYEVDYDFLSSSPFVKFAINRDTTDTDNDGVDNVIDIDDDNDGILDKIEDSTCLYHTVDLSKVNLVKSTVGTVNIIQDSIALSSNNSWYSQYSAETYNLPLHIELVTNTSNIAMIGLHPITNTQPAENTYASNAYVIYSNAATTSFGIPTNLGPTYPYTNGTKLELDIDENGIYKFTSNGIIIKTGIAPITEYKLAFSLYSAGVKQYSNVKFTDNININYCYGYDTDNDGIRNSLDIDSDGDNCNDAIEGGATNSLSTVVPLTSTVGANGFVDNLEKTPESNTFNYLLTYNYFAIDSSKKACFDFDTDGIPDATDIDDDNDGVLDAEEQGLCTYESHDLKNIEYNVVQNNIKNNSDQIIMEYPLLSWFQVFSKDTFSLPIHLEFETKTIAESANIGLAPIGKLMSQTNFSDSAYRINFNNNQIRAKLLTLHPIYDHIATYTPGQKVELDIDKNGILTYKINGILYHRVQAPITKYLFTVGIYGTNKIFDSIKLSSGYKAVSCVDIDTDGDGIVNRLDTDSDGDNCNDGVEAGALNITDAAPITSAVGINGFADNLESTLDKGDINYLSNYKQHAVSSNFFACFDFDSDGISDWIDLDIDDDGVLNETEKACFNPIFVNKSSISTATEKSISGIALKDYDSISYKVTITGDAPTYVATNYEAANGIHFMVNDGNKGYLNLNLDLNSYAMEQNLSQIPTTLNYVEFGSSVPYNVLINTTSFNEPANYVFNWPGSYAILIDPNNQISSHNDGDTIFNDEMLSQDVRINLLTDAPNWKLRMYINNDTTHSNINVSIFGNNALLNEFYGFNLNSCSFIDSDNDLNPNHYDTDSDQDGCSDAYESGATTDNTLTSFSAAVGNNGMTNSLETNDKILANHNYTTSYSMAVSNNVNKCLDTDNDLISNYIDIDDDNDGILDNEELNCGIGEMILPSTIDASINGIKKMTSDIIKGAVSAEYSLELIEVSGAMTTTDFDNSKTGIHYKFTDNDKVYSQRLLITPITPSAINKVSFGVNAPANSLSPASVIEAQSIEMQWNPDFTAIVYDPADQLVGLATNDIITSGTTIITAANYTIAASSWRIDFVCNNTNALFALTTKHRSTTVASLAIEGFGFNTTLCTVNDFDDDGISNELDLDSDGDGCSDAFESSAASSSSGTNQTIPGPYGANGFAASLESNDLISASITYSSSAYLAYSITNSCVDTDNDGIVDKVDIDDDNDGILDQDEYSCADGLYVKSYEITSGISVGYGGTFNNGNFRGTLNTNFSNLTSYLSSTNNVYNGSYKISDADKNYSYRAVIAPSSSMLSEIAFGPNLPDNSVNGSVVNQMQKIVLNWKLPIGAYVYDPDNQLSSHTHLQPYIKGDTIRTVGDLQAGISTWKVIIPLSFISQDFVLDASFTANTTNFGQETFGVSTKLCDKYYDLDSDGKPNSVDLDSDGDSCFDAVESNNLQYNSLNDSIILGPYGLNGFSSLLESSDDLVTNKNYTLSNNFKDATIKACADTDSDSIPDIVDIDDDNDGILDQTECPTVDPISGYYYQVVDAQGKVVNILSKDDNSILGKITIAPVQNIIVDGLVPNNIDNSFSGHWADLGNGPIQERTMTIKFEPVSAPFLKLAVLATEGGNGQWWFHSRRLTIDGGIAGDGTVVGIPQKYYLEENYKIGDKINNTSLISTAFTGYLGSSTNKVFIQVRYDAVATAANPLILTYTWRAKASNVANENFGFQLLDLLPIPDTVKCDFDNDGITNDLDSDSDDDGCSDAKESGHKKPVYTSNGKEYITGVYGENGFSSLVETNDSLNAKENYTLLKSNATNDSFDYLNTEYNLACVKYLKDLVISDVACTGPSLSFKIKFREFNTSDSISLYDVNTNTILKTFKILIPADTEQIITIPSYTTAQSFKFLVRDSLDTFTLSNTVDTTIAICYVRPKIDSLPGTNNPGSNLTFCEGSSAYLHVTTNADTIQWLKNNSPLVGQNDDSLQVFDSGVYRAVLKFKSGFKDTLDSVNVYHIKYPNATITSGSVLAFSCATTTMNLTANDCGSCSYQWFKDSVLIPGATTNVLNVSSIGSYYVQETVNSYGCMASSSISKTIALPTALPSGSSTVCEGDSNIITVDASSFVAPITYSWEISNDDGTTWVPISSVPNSNSSIVVKYSTAEFQGKKSYRVNIIDNNSTAATTCPVSITTLAKPLPVFTGDLSNPVNICADDSARLSIISPENYSNYQWYYKANLSDNYVALPLATDSFYKTNKAGYYTINLKSTDGCSGSSADRELTVTPNALTTDIQVPGPYTTCIGNTLTLNASSTTATTLPVTYKWYSDTMLTSLLFTGNSYTSTPINGPQKLFVTVENSQFCQNNVGSALVVNLDVATTSNALSVSYIGDTLVCVDDSAKLNASTTTVTNPIFKWYKDPLLTQLLYIGNAFTIQSASTDTNVYITVEGDNSCQNLPNTATVAKVKVKQYSLLSNLTGVNDTVCFNENGIVSIASDIPSSIVNIYSDSLLTTLLSSISTHTENNVTSTKKYFATSYASNYCENKVGTALPLYIVVPPTLDTPTNVQGELIVNSNKTYNYKIDPVLNATSYIWTLPNGYTGTSTIDNINVTIGSLSDTIRVKAVNQYGCEGPERIIVLTLTKKDTIYKITKEDSTIKICHSDLISEVGLGGVLSSCDGSFIIEKGTFDTVGYASTGCFNYIPINKINGKDSGCIVNCKNNVCDTTIIYIDINPITDTINVIFPEDSFISICKSSILPLGQNTTISSCSGNFEYNNTVLDSTNYANSITDTCVKLFSKPNYFGKDTGCIVACIDNVCDTTIILIEVTPKTDTTYITVPEDSVSKICSPTIGTGTSITTCNSSNNTMHGTVDLTNYPSCIDYTPTPNYSGYDTACIVTCNGVICDTTIVIIKVIPNPDTIIITPTCLTCTDVICSPIDITSSLPYQTTLCNNLSEYSIVGPDANNCIQVKAIGVPTQVAQTCLYVCKGDICGTTTIIINLPKIPDTITILPLCDTCSVVGCVDTTQIEFTGATITSCGAPAGYTEILTDSCISYKPNGNVKDTVETCISICKDGICDTTRVVILPPVPTPDTITILPLCDTCSVVGCVDTTDVELVGATITSCGAPAGYTETMTSNCISYTPSGNVKDTVETCISICKDGRCDTTRVVILPPVPTPDTITILPLCDTCSVVGCVDTTDVELVGATITSCGAPAGYTETITNNCVSYKPSGNVKDTVETCISICKDGRCDTTRVVILPPVPTPDTITILPLCDTCSVVGCVDTTDVELVGATITSCGAPAGYTETMTSNCISYTPSGNVKDTVETCISICKDGRCDTTRVVILPPVPTPDTITILPLCDTCSVVGCVDTTDVELVGATITSCGAPAGYTETMTSNCISYTPSGNVKDTVETCISICKDGRCDTTRVVILPPVPTPDTITILPLCDTCSVVGCVDTTDVELVGATITSCGAPAGYTETMTSNCISYTPSGNVKDTVETCISICKDGRCDTTRVVILPPVPTPDTITILPLCDTCSVVGCVDTTDVELVGATITSCGAPAGYTETMTSNCISYTPSGNVKDTVETCISICKDGRCDTTRVVILPPVPTPDTITILPLCDTCSVVGCVDTTDVELVGATITSCGAPAGYTETMTSNCISYKPSGNVKDTVETCISICKDGRCDTTRVVILPPVPTPDTITILPLCDTCSVVGCVDTTDVELVGATITSCGAPAGYTETMTSNCISYKPSGNVKDTVETCISICKDGRCDTTRVVILPPVPTPDTITILPLCDTCSVVGCVDTTDVELVGATITSCGAPAGYTETITNNCVSYKPSGNVKDTVETCISICKDGRCDTTRVVILPPVPTPDTITILPLCDTCSVVGCVDTTDVELVGATITSCGAPAGYTETMTSNCISYTPSGNVKDTVETCISICKDGRCDTTRVVILPPVPTPDTITILPLCDTCSVVGCVDTTDVELVGATITSCGAPAGYTETMTSNCISYTPSGNVKDTVETCISICKDGRCDTTRVVILPPVPTPDTITILPLCDTCSVVGCVDTTDVELVGATITSCGAPAGYTETMTSNCISYKPSGNVKDTVETCISICKDGRCDTTRVVILPPVPTPDTITILPLCDTCSVVGCVDTTDVELVGATITSCGAPAGYTETMTSNCISYTPSGNVKDTVETCISICKDGRCDTTRVVILPPVPTPDTITILPLCDTCSVVGCIDTTDVELVGATITSCGAPAGYTETMTSNCISYTPSGNVKDTVETCISICKDGRCDTTRVVILPPVPTPDTITILPLCDTCSVVGCVDTTDVELVGATITSCGAPAGYTETMTSNCISYTPSGNVKDTVETCISICKDGRCDTTRVVILPPVPTPDTITILPLCDTCSVVGCVDTTDVELVGATITSCGAPAGYTETMTSNCISYTPSGNVKDTVETCISICKDGRCDTTRVVILPPVPTPDTITILPLCDTCSVVGCVDTTDVELVGATITSCGAPAGYTETMTSNCISYTPSGNVKDTVETCISICKDGRCDTTRVVILPPVPKPDTITILPLCDTCSVVGCVDTTDVELVGATITSCGAPAGYTETMTSNCISYTPSGNVKDTVETCISICKDGRCDTTRVVILPPVPTPDTITILPLCDTCSVVGCIDTTDVELVGATITSCGAPAGYTETMTSNCISYTPSGNVKDTVETCISICKDGRCDTTRVVILPPVPTPDTITILPLCDTCSVVGCIDTTDVELVGATITSCGAPAGYTETMTSNCISYTPSGNVKDTVETCISICKDGRCDTTRVVILPPVPTPDTITILPLCDTCSVVGCVDTTDVELVGATITSCGAPAGYTETITNNCVSYKPSGNVKDTVETCISICKDGRCDTTRVVILPPVPTPDTITILPLCDTCSVVGCVDTTDVELVGATITSCGAPAGYTETMTSNCISYTPSGNVKDTVETCISICKDGRCDTTRVVILPPVPKPDTITILPLCDTCSVVGCVDTTDVELVGATITSCGAPAGYTETMTSNCISYTPSGNVKDTVETCISICKDGRCDTTRVVILPPVPTPDTITILPLCDTCSVVGCVDTTDVELVGATITSCGAPAGYTETMTSNCISYTPSGNVKDTVETCISICKDGRCDTTRVVILPPVPTPDTITILPLCDTCSVVGCVDTTDVELVGATITSCGAPAGYTETITNNCISYTPSGNVKDTVETCISICKDGRCDTTRVVILPPVPTPDTITILPLCDTCSVVGCVDTTDVELVGATITSCGAPAGYTETMTSNCISYTPSGNVKDTVETCISICKDGRCDTTRVVILPPVPTPDTITILPLCDTCSVVGCVDTTDVELVGATITSCGAPAGYTETMTSNCISYTPSGNVKDTVETCISICKDGRCDTTRVVILPPVPTPDTITILPLCDTCSVVGCVDTTDVELVGATITSCGAPAGYTETITNNCVSYKPSGNVKDTVETCISICKDGRCDTTRVVILPPVPTPDTLYKVVACQDCEVTFCVDTTDVELVGATITSCGAPANYITTVDGICYTYKANFATTIQETCISICNNGRCDTTFVVIVPPPTSPDTIVLKPLCDTCTVTACVDIREVDTTNPTISATCGIPAGYTSVTNKYCFDFTTSSGVKDTVYTCLAICDGTRCDYTYVIILPPPTTPDTVVVRPICSSCSVTVCPINNDLNPTGDKSFSFPCGEPEGYTKTGPDMNGCFNFIPNTIVSILVKTCIVTCIDGRCDTTYVIINPPITPDTVIVNPACPTCSISVCPIGDDINKTDAGDVTYSYCELGAEYSIISKDPTTGCLTIKPVVARGKGTVDKTCIVICKNGVCDTTFVFIYGQSNVDTIIDSTIVDIGKGLASIPSYVFEGTKITTTYISSASSQFTVENGIVTYTPAKGVEGIDTIRVLVCDEFNNCYYRIYFVTIYPNNTRLPNIMTPNGDGINDNLDLSIVLNKYPNAKLNIYNRWGNVVWRSIGTYLNYSFDGKHYLDNQPLPDGVYYYIIELTEEYESFINGFIEIMRN